MIMTLRIPYTSFGGQIGRGTEKSGRSLIIRARHHEKNRVIMCLSCTSGRACRCEESGLSRLDFDAMSEVGWLMEHLLEILNLSRLASERW
jgi:hypothetical protein